MADVTISGLSQGIPNKGSAIIPYSDGTTTYKTSPSGIVAASPGSLLQIVGTSDNTYRTTTSNIPRNAIPQITQGNLFLSVNITPKSASSQLLFLFEGYCMELANQGDNAAFPLFRDNNANAIHVFYQEMSHSQSFNMFRCNGHFLYQNNTTNTTTYSVRWGINGGTLATLGGVTYFPQDSYGGLVSNKLTIQEIAG